MRNDEIRINGEYYTRVSGRLIKVIVTAEKNITSWTGGKTRRMWCIKRKDNGKSLDARNAAALHMTTNPLLEADNRAQAKKAKERQKELPPLPHKPTPRPEFIPGHELAAGGGIAGDLEFNEGE